MDEWGGSEEDHDMNDISEETCHRFKCTEGNKYRVTQSDTYRQYSNLREECINVAT